MRRINWVLLSLSIMAVVFGGAMLARGLIDAAPDTPVAREAVKAPDFKLKLLSGETVRLSDFKGKKPVVVNFWASWCGPCRSEASSLAKVSKTYADRVQFLGVAVQDRPESAKSFIDDFGLEYMNGLDDGIAAKYGVTGIPATFFIDKKGQVVDSWVGAIDSRSLIARLNKIM